MTNRTISRREHHMERMAAIDISPERAEYAALLRDIDHATRVGRISPVMATLFKTQAQELKTRKTHVTDRTRRLWAVLESHAMVVRSRRLEDATVHAIDSGKVPAQEIPGIKLEAAAIKLEAAYIEAEQRTIWSALSPHVSEGQTTTAQSSRGLFGILRRSENRQTTTLEHATKGGYA